jgi:hypothetical protein
VLVRAMGISFSLSESTVTLGFVLPLGLAISRS